MGHQCLIRQVDRFADLSPVDLYLYFANPLLDVLASFQLSLLVIRLLSQELQLLIVRKRLETSQRYLVGLFKLRGIKQLLHFLNKFLLLQFPLDLCLLSPRKFEEPPQIGIAGKFLLESLRLRENLWIFLFADQLLDRTQFSLQAFEVGLFFLLLEDERPQLDDSRILWVSLANDLERAHSILEASCGQVLSSFRELALLLLLCPVLARYLEEFCDITVFWMLAFEADEQ